MGSKKLAQQMLKEKKNLEIVQRRKEEKQERMRSNTDSLTVGLFYLILERSTRYADDGNIYIDAAEAIRQLEMEVGE